VRHLDETGFRIGGKTRLSMAARNWFFRTLRAIHSSFQERIIT
jgi:hypothetical protein